MGYLTDMVHESMNHKGFGVRKLFTSKGDERSIIHTSIY